MPKHSAARSRVMPALVVILAAAAIAQIKSAWAPACDETRTGTYIFEKLGGSQLQPVKISLCADLACKTKSDFATVDKDTYSAPRPSGIARPYFLIERRGERKVIGARHLALQGAYNFRDLGGTSDSGWQGRPVGSGL